MTAPLRNHQPPLFFPPVVAFVLSFFFLPFSLPQPGATDYGFVEFEDHSAAERALQRFAGTKLAEKELKVNWANSSPSPHHSNSSGHHGHNNNHHHQGSRYSNARDHHGGAKPGANGLFNVFVGDLDTAVDETGLRGAFATYQSLEDVKVMLDAEGASRGFGFVMFKEQTDAQNAIAEMQGRPLLGRNLRLNWAHPQVPARGEGRGEGNGGRYNNGNYGEGREGGRKGNHHSQHFPPAPLDYNEVLNASHQSNVTVYVGNLSPEVTSAKLQELFSPFGEIAEVRDHADTRSSTSSAANASGEPEQTPTYRGYGFILFKSHEAAARAIVALNGHVLNGKVLKCSWGSEKRPISNTSGAPLPGFPYGPSAYSGYSNMYFYQYPYVQGIQGTSIPSGASMPSGNFWYPPAWPPQNASMMPPPHMPNMGPMSFPPGTSLTAPSQTTPNAMGSIITPPIGAPSANGSTPGANPSFPQ